MPRGLKISHPSPNIDEKFSDTLLQIPVSLYNPSYSVKFTAARATPPNDWFVKQSHFISFDRIGQGLALTWLQKVAQREKYRRTLEATPAT